MPSFLSRFKGKDGPSKLSKSKKNAPQGDVEQAPPKPKWEDAWTRKTVDPEEVQELLRGCTIELKSRALDMPFMLLPFRPTSDPSAARSFIRNYFDRGQALHGDFLVQELRLTEPMVLCSVVKWCWSRMPGGVVSWDAYELFRVGEQDSSMARDSFATFIPLSVESDARTKIIFDFFDLLAAIAAHGKTNGLGGRKLSRLAAWWAFEHSDGGKGFEGGYRGWKSAADATSHLFFAYLRSLSPDSVKGINGISTLPMSLQKLVQETEYPPETPSLMQTRTTKVVMIVNAVSPTPFALLRRANHFQYRDEDRALQQFSDYEDPVRALTDECKRVLKSISSANQSQVSTSKQSTGLRDASWSRFEDIGFSGSFDEAEEDEDDEGNFLKRKKPQGLRTTPQSQMAGGRPTTPSWADFLSSGFVDEAKNGPAPLLLPPDKILPPIDTSRGRSSQSHAPRLETDNNLEPGELASIARFDLDDAFWWVWISSLAGEEPAERKAAFGRCALVETIIPGGKWLVMEEVVKGAAAEPAEGAYVAEKKSRFGWTRRSKGSARRKSTGKREDLEGPQNLYKGSQSVGVSKTSIGPDQHARIQAAAAHLQQKQRLQETQQSGARRGRNDTDTVSQKTNSVFTLQPVIMHEASPAMKWASKYDKDAIKEAYLANNAAGKGLGEAPWSTNGNGYHSGDLTPGGSVLQRNPSSTDRDLPKIPTETEVLRQDTRPVVPVKSPSPPPAQLPPTPAPVEVKQQQYMSEKAAEVALPSDIHPIDRKQADATPRVEASLESSRAEEPRDVYTPEPDLKKVITKTSPEGKHHKLQKKVAGQEARGFRKMFGRNKNRDSKLPESAPTVPNGNQAATQLDGQLQPGGATLGRRFSGFRKKSDSSSPKDASTPVFAPTPEPIVEDVKPVQISEPTHDMSYDPSLRESVSRVDTADAHEAHQAFSSFDQGPLDDMPAFAPTAASLNDSEPDEVAPPPVVLRSKAPFQAPAPIPAPAPAPAPSAIPKKIATPAPVPVAAPIPAPAEDGAELTKEVSPVQVSDRWAQIRKNAAERAAQRQQTEEQQPKAGQSAPSAQSTGTDNDGETSGEETIESRVARIKARVAELTGNMEGNGSTPNSGNRSPARWQ